MKTTNIYTLTDPRTNEIRYVGKANNITERYRAHLNRARDHQTHKRNWVNSLRKLGLKPIINVIDIVPINEWVFWETYWVHQFKAWGFKLTNATDGGDGLTCANKNSFKKGQGGKKVVGYNSEGEKVYVFETAQDATNFFKTNKSSIPRCASGKCKSKTIKNIAWFYIDDVLSCENIKEKIKNRFVKNLKSNTGSFVKGQKGLRSIKIFLIDLKTNEKSIFNSGVEVANYLGVKQHTISWALRNNKIIKKQFKIEKYE